MEITFVSFWLEIISKVQVISAFHVILSNNGFGHGNLRCLLVMALKQNIMEMA